MDALLQDRVKLLAKEIAGEARTIDDVNELMRLVMKSALERMLDTEMDVHLGRWPRCTSISVSSCRKYRPSLSGIHVCVSDCRPLPWSPSCGSESVVRGCSNSQLSGIAGRALSRMKGPYYRTFSGNDWQKR